MTPAGLVRASGLSKQHVSQLLDESKTRLGRMVADKTIAGLGRAFPEVGEVAFITKAAEAMGVPVDRLEVVSPNYDALSNDALIAILSERLKGASWPVTLSPEDEDVVPDAPGAIDLLGPDDPQSSQSADQRLPPVGNGRHPRR